MAAKNFLAWNWDGPRSKHTPLDKLEAIADVFFGGHIIMTRRGGKWTVMLGEVDLEEKVNEELANAPTGLSLPDTIAEALRRAAPLSEEE